MEVLVKEEVVKLLAERLTTCDGMMALVWQRWS